MARRKKKVRGPGFWAMVGRGWRKFKAFLGSDLWYCPHGWGRFCPKCRLWTARQLFNKAGLQWIVEAGNGQSVQPFMDALKAAMRTEDVELFKVLEDDVLETEVEGVNAEGESILESSKVPPQPRPETEEKTETCPGCGNPKVVRMLCPDCGHYTGEDVPYDVPEEAAEDVEEEDLE